ncbi:hypothetical protein N7490_004043 [Penicillium lividum]|nr:hypothetical protein N7490_004043 [Penicillium lividum]
MASSPDGIRLYEHDQEGLLASIVIANDVANLHRYVEDCGPPSFCEPGERRDDYFFMATVNGSTDTLLITQPLQRRSGPSTRSSRYYEKPAHQWFSLIWHTRRPRSYKSKSWQDGRKVVNG